MKAGLTGQENTGPFECSLMSNFPSDFTGCARVLKCYMHVMCPPKAVTGGFTKELHGMLPIRINHGFTGRYTHIKSFGFMLAVRVNSP